MRTHRYVRLAALVVFATLPLKEHASSFRLTHRFTRDLRRGPFSDLAQGGVGVPRGEGALV